MSKLTITLSSKKIPTGTPLVIDLLDASLNQMWRGSVLVNEPYPLSLVLRAGDYVVVVGLPSGQDVPILFYLADEDISAIEVSLPPALERVGRAASSATSRWAYSASHLDNVWIRLWSRDAARPWRVQRWTVSVKDAGDGSLRGEFEADKLPVGQHYLQIGSGSSQPRMTAIPAGRASFVLRPVARYNNDEAAGLPVDIEIDAGTTEAQVLLGYLTNGDLERAQVIGKDVLVPRISGDRRLDPTTAVLSAYYCLACRDFERLTQLVDYLSQWKNSLPDYAVIAAWKSFRQDPPAVEVGRDFLLEAVRCGIPIYTRGLRLLTDGLRMVEDDRDLCNDNVRRAGNRLRQFAQMADWRPPFTTFSAVHPNKPINPRGGIHWLSDARRAASDPLSYFPWASTEGEEREEPISSAEAGEEISAAFSRAFARPPGLQSTRSAEMAYEAFQKDLTNLFEAAS